MIPFVLAAMFLSLVTTAFGQRRAQPWPPGGYGTLRYHGAGHVPVAPPGPSTWPSSPGKPLPAAQPAVENAEAPSGFIVIPAPVYENSSLDDESGMLTPEDGYPPQATTNLDDRPPVVVDQNFASPQEHSRFANHNPAPEEEFALPVSQTPRNSYASAVQGTSNTRGNDGKPTIYLIAFRNHRIIEALGFWTEGTMFHYVTVDYAFNHASIALLDPDLSRRLNHERGIQFKLTDLD